MGLKGRLIVAFLTIIILPVLTVFGMLGLFAVFMEDVTEEQNYEINEFMNTINETVLNEIDVLKASKAEFYEILQPIVGDYEVEVVVTDSDGVIFDSAEWTSNKSASWENGAYMITMRQSQVQTLSGELFNVEIRSASLDLAATQSYQQIIINIILSFASGLFVLIILVVCWTIYISRTVLNPLKEIYIATEEMTEGNLDYEIPYKRKDEIGRFISGFNLMRRHLKDSIAKQREYERNRKELIASVSHDLRTPLQSIKGYVEGIRDGIVQDEAMKERYVNVILSKTEQLDRLIEDLFEFSKIELDRLNMEMKLVNSEDFLRDIFINGSSDMKQKDVEIRWPTDIPAVLLNVDPYRIKQVFDNLFDNAARYGGTVISLNVKLYNEERQLIISVKDNGEGIREQDKVRIFERFYRGEKSRSREYGGTGLGLAIVKSIIEAHKGTVTVESEIGLGSEFTIYLPYINEK
ncbi:MAG: ATP-binding protein [Bacillus sp. (in: Bacteria)]|nr:ATP-binding protein [Bacillus sp. (in: firmicutes)]